MVLMKIVFAKVASARERERKRVTHRYCQRRGSRWRKIERARFGDITEIDVYRTRARKTRL